VGQKVNPLSFRLGIFEDWRAHWFAKKNVYGGKLEEDFQVREYLKKHLNYSDIEKIVIDKAAENIRIIIFSSRPGLIIGKKGLGIEQLKSNLYTKFKKNIDISVQEPKDQEVSAVLISKSIADQLVKRANFKRLMKKVGFSVMRSGAKGIKICCSGRLAGAEIARSEWLRLGSIPLHTLRANVDFAHAEAKTTYGIIGVKVWVCKGQY